MELNSKDAKPFLKWAGGKTQLLPVIEKALPIELLKNNFTYIEPFVGSGAVLFWMLNNFPNLQRAVINDINTDLINVYQIIANEPKQLIAFLEVLQIEYHGFKEDEDKKKEYYYLKRELYNTRNTDKCTQAALFIFLNRTCFNGLYRVNSKNGFNVPMGRYNSPTICDTENIFSVSSALQKVELLNGDFETTLPMADKNSFFYFDPPYKPLSMTSSFNTYSVDDFNNESQKRLCEFCRNLDVIGHKWILSNSDVKGKDNNDNFFDDLFANFNISRVRATRRINSNAEKRGELNELLIKNYINEQTLSIA